jgi:hypothetical protein
MGWGKNDPFHLPCNHRGNMGAPSLISWWTALASHTVTTHNYISSSSMTTLCCAVLVLRRCKCDPTQPGKERGKGGRGPLEPGIRH